MKYLLFLGLLATAPLPAQAGLLDGLLPKGMGAAQNRCLNYGFTDKNKLARCTEIEMRYDRPKAWKFSETNAAQNTCMVLGYSKDALAACVQRKLRNLD